MSKRFIFGGSYRGSKSVYFDGIDQDCRYVDNTFNSLSGGTFSAWLYINSYSAGNAHIWGATRADTNNYINFAYLNTGQLAIVGATAGTLKYVAYDTTGNLATGTWYHLAWTKTGTTHALYVNGAARTLNFTVSVDKSVHYNSIPANVLYTLGQYRRTTNANYVNGYMKDIVITPTAWSLAQVQEAYNSGCPLDMSTHSDYANIITWSRMGDGVGDAYPTITDQKGSNNLTMVNMSAANIQNVSPC